MLLHCTLNNCRVVNTTIACDSEGVHVYPIGHRRQRGDVAPSGSQRTPQGLLVVMEFDPLLSAIWPDVKTLVVFLQVVARLHVHAWRKMRHIGASYVTQPNLIA